MIDKMDIYQIFDDAFEKIRQTWINLNLNHKFLRWVPFILALYYFVDAILAQYILQITMMQEIPLWEIVFLAMACVGFYVSTTRYIEDYVPYVLFFSTALLALSVYIFWFLVITLATLIIYKLLENHRIKRLEKFAKSTPAQIAGVKYQKPEVEIVIRGGGRE